MRTLWRPVLDRITPYDPGKPLEVLAAELGLDALVRLSANENPLGPSPHVVAAIEREAPRAHLYPDGASHALRDALGRRLGVAPDRIVVGNGADELLSLIAWALLDPGDEVIVTHPSFEPYTSVVTLAGAHARPSPLAGYDTDLDDIGHRVTPRTKAIVLCSPHNPATTIVRAGPLTAFLDALGEDSPLIVLDEAYHDFADDPEYPSGVSLLARYPRVLVLRTFSKIAGLAGLRVGYAIGSADNIDRLNRVRAPYNVNRLGQVAALAALEDREHWERTRRVVIEERRFLTTELGRRGFAFPPSQANFLLLRVPDAPTARDELLRAGLVVRDGATVGFPGHLRLSFGLRDTNAKLVSVLERFAR
jgi:histidinol-phosphate aminotransferase